jgi:rubrerythrin
MLKHPVIKSIMGMDETQEQLDFVQPHKRIPVTLTVSGDLISREAVLDSIERMKPYQQDADDIMEMIQNFPSVKPQEKTGHWTPYRNEADVYKCTACGAIVYEYPTSWNYCPWCGARMGVEKND